MLSFIFPYCSSVTSNRKPQLRHGEETEQSFLGVLPFKWILAQPLLIPRYPSIAFIHLSIHPFIPVPSFMTGLSADINQLREKIPPLSCAAFAPEEDDVENTDVIGMRIGAGGYTRASQMIHSNVPCTQRAHLKEAAILEGPHLW